MNYYISAGEKLLEAQERCVDERKDFWGWFKTEDFPVGRDQARRYMKLATAVAGERKVREFPSIRKAIGEPHEPRVSQSWASEVRDYVEERVEPARYAEDSRVSEDRQLRELGMQLIDIGFKVLAAQFHPDKSGGSKEAMQNSTRSVAF